MKDGFSQSEAVFYRSHITISNRLVFISKNHLLLFTSHSFSDINECELETACDHICVNTPGSYFCACRPGYDSYGFSHCAGNLKIHKVVMGLLTG